MDYPEFFFISNQKEGSISIQRVKSISDLFHQAILMSGSDRSKWAAITDIEEAKSYARDLADELGCPGNDNNRMITCMRLYRTADEIVNASAKVRVKVGRA